MPLPKAYWRELLTVVCLFGGTLAGFQGVSSCVSQRAAEVIHEEVFTVDREVFYGLWNPVMDRIQELGDLDPELVDEALRVDAALGNYSGGIPSQAAHQVAMVCDVHDMLVLTAPDPVPFLQTYMRSTELLRELFRAANEPLLQLD